jgi:hypothetical protein
MHVSKSLTFSQSGVERRAVRERQLAVEQAAVAQHGLRWIVSRRSCPRRRDWRQTFAGWQRHHVNNNWGPRFGISYDITGNAKTLIKASYGEFWLFRVRTSPAASTRAATWVTNIMDD